MFCFLKQWRISSALDDGRTVPPVLLRHAERCERCAAFLAGSRKLGAALRAEARVLRAAAPAAADAAGRRITRMPTWRRMAPLTAAAAVMLLAVGASQWLGRSRPQRPKDLVANPPAPQARPAMPDPFRLEPILADSLAMLEQSVTAPMDREIGGVTRDAQTAIATLLSYLPRQDQPRSHPR